MAARGLRESRRGGGIRWVGRDGGGICSEGRLDDGLDDCVYVRVQRWRRDRTFGIGARDRTWGVWGARVVRATATKVGAEEATGKVVSMREGEGGLVGPDAT